MVRAILAAVLVLALGGCVTHRKRIEDPQALAAARGHAVAARSCSGCHAIEANAASPNPRAPGFTTLEMRHTAGLEGRLAMLTSQGHYEMPPQRLTPDEVRDLVSYIEGSDARP